ncbi:Hypothetical_protein [Hexamita inflata]|uniref:Hypothetical_protein n=1 Tax=Hexamita inflata TaxID=28002 RepID=A0AA86QC38_9EUKA|nr:Hypothetical protein HINF_LOCUS44149 [Hexamita inflata]
MKEYLESVVSFTRAIWLNINWLYSYSLEYKKSLLSVVKHQIKSLVSYSSKSRYITSNGAINIQSESDNAICAVYLNLYSSNHASVENSRQLSKQSFKQSPVYGLKKKQL